MERLLISEVIFSFKEALKLSRRLFSILGDFGFGGPAMLTSWSEKQGFLLLLVKLDLHLHFRCSAVDCYSSFGFL